MQLIVVVVAAFAASTEAFANGDGPLTKEVPATPAPVIFSDDQCDERQTNSHLLWSCICDRRMRHLEERWQELTGGQPLNCPADIQPVNATDG